MKYSIFLTSLLFSGSLWANDYQPLFDSCLSLKQGTDTSEAQPCRFFIQGFMAAASLTGVPMDPSLKKDNSDFFNRAYDSRLGLTSADKRQKACDVPKNQELIITEVSKNIPEKFETLLDLKLIIINALKNNQSCRPKKQ
jgi:hypothetical protein